MTEEFGKLGGSEGMLASASTSKRMHSRRFTAGVLGASALVQFVSLLFVGNQVSGGDAQTYLRIAQDWLGLDRLLSPEAFEANFWPAGYPGLLALAIPFGDHQLLAVRVVQIVFVLALAWLAADMAQRVSTAAARVTLVVVAFSPTLIWAMWAIGYELLLALLLTLALWLIWRDHPSPRVSMAAGVAFALALIVQFRALPVVIVLLVLAWRRGARALGWFILGAALPVLLWSIRSLVATGSPAPWSANGGYNLWNGNGPHATGHNVYPLPTPPNGTSPGAAALDWILDYPSQAIELMARKAIFLFYPTEIAGVSEVLPAERVISVAQWIYSAVVVVLLVCFVGALVWGASPRLQGLAPVAALVALYLLPNVLFIVEARFRIPVEALLLALASATAWELWNRRRAVRDRSAHD